MDLRTSSRSHPLGLQRVIDPTGVLPQAADRLDNDDPAFPNELVIDVERLNIDAASFHQLYDACDGDLDALADRVRDIVDKRGKMHNPVTGSGGMLTGVVRAIGPDYTDQNDRTDDLKIVVGDRVATLVSLTLTPLDIDDVVDVHPDADQLTVRGTAYLPPSAPIVVMPEDLEPNVALKAYDVCGAPAQMRRLVEDLDDPTILILGVGTSGMLCAAAAHHTLDDSSDATILAVDRDTDLAERLADRGLIDAVGHADATRPVDVLGTTEDLLDDASRRTDRVDLALNTCNVGGTEMSTVLPVRPRGTAFFFNMATDFAAATLGAEGAGRDIDLMMGNGYTRGHADLTTTLLREYPTVREELTRLVA